MTTDTDTTTSGLFEISGGALCLDFANTWGNQLDPGTDRLRDYGHLIAFARQTEYLPEGTATALLVAAGTDVETGTAAFALSRELRDVIYRIFSSRARGREVRLVDVDRINSLLGEALSHRKLESRDGNFVWSWADMNTDDLRAPIWPVIESAAALLTSDDFDRVRECNAKDCNWLFLDRSRAGTRRWCSMKSCGNRAKARRHYQRRRQG